MHNPQIWGAGVPPSEQPPAPAVATCIRRRLHISGPPDVTDVKRLAGFAAVELRVDEAGNQAAAMTTNLEIPHLRKQNNLLATGYANSLS